MPCDNSEYDGSDFGSIQTDSLEPRHRANSSGTLTDKDSSDVLLRHSYDKGKLARSLSNTSSDFEPTNKKIDCHSSEYCRDSSCHRQHLVTSDSSDSRKCLTRKDFLTINSNKLLDLTTHDNDEGQMSCNDHHQARQQDLSVPFYCQRGRNPISMNDLSVDLPKASVSPGVESKIYPSPFFGTNIPLELHEDMKRAFINEGFYMVTDMDKDFYGNPYTNKASSSQAAHTHSMTLYNSMGSRLDHLQSRSKPYAHFDGCSSLALPRLNTSWPSDVMIKSSPELSSYFSHSPLEKGPARNPPIYRGSTSSMPFDLSQGKHGGDAASPHSSSTTTLAKPDREYSRESSRLSASSLAIGKNDSLGTRETARDITDSCSSLSPGFVIKMEDESLSPGRRSPHHLSSPYRSTSLSPWPVSSDFGRSNEALGTTIKDKVKCASDSSLYLPTMVHAPPSPISSSVIAKEEVVAVECRWKMCTQTLTSQRALAQHVNDCHVRIERPDVDFQCHWQGCPRQGKGFNARYKMLIHIRTHTNEKPHKCAVCRKCFSRLENLKIHMRSHTGEKPYACTFPGCTKAYSNSSDRFKHVRTHQEEKPYKCKMASCHKQYTDPSSLRKHVRTHGHGTTAVQTPLQHSVSRSNEFQISDDKLTRKDENSVPYRRHSVDVHTGIKMDADRQMRQDLNNGMLDMRDIQRNIELYSSLEVKGGIQTFGQVEDCIQNEFQPTVLRNSSKRAQEMMSEEISLSTEDDMFDKKCPPSNKPPLLSVPSIIIEDAEDGSKSVDDLPSYGKEFDLSKPKRKRSDSLEVDHSPKAVNVSSGEEGGEDLRKCFKDEDATDQRSCEKSKSTSPSSFPGDKGCSANQATTTTASSSPSSHPKHWKKRKILDEENLQRKQQQQEEEEKRAEQLNEVLCEERSRAQLLLEVMAAHSVRPSPDLNLSAHLLRSFDSQSLALSSIASAKCCETMSSSSALSPPHTSLVSSGGHHYSPASLPASYYPSVCCSSLAPCTYNPAVSPHHPPTFISPSLFTSYPELHPAHHNFTSSKFDHPLSAAATSAVFFPKAAKACSHLYFPYLSALMDLSSGLDPLSQHHPHLSHMALSSHPMAVDSPATMICPMVCPPTSRTLHPT